MGNPKGGEEGEFLDGGGRGQGRQDKDLNLVTTSESFLDFLFFLKKQKRERVESRLGEKGKKGKEGNTGRGNTKREFREKENEEAADQPRPLWFSGMYTTE